MPEPERDAGRMVWKILTNPEKKERRARILEKWDAMFEENLAEFHIQAIRLHEPEDETHLPRLAFRHLIEQVLRIDIDLKYIKGVPENSPAHIDGERLGPDV